jgi:hypothetical protein
MVGIPYDKGDIYIVELLGEKHMALKEGKLICTDLSELEKNVLFYRKKSAMERKREASKNN